jgi:hypothetical protein
MVRENEVRLGLEQTDPKRGRNPMLLKVWPPSLSHMRFLEYSAVYPIGKCSLLRTPLRLGESVQSLV